jgi:hypothetical protein
VSRKSETRHEVKPERQQYQMTEIQMIEEPCSKLQGFFDRKEVGYS